VFLLAIGPVILKDGRRTVVDTLEASGEALFPDDGAGIIIQR